jgi:hypothetical protein
MSDKSFNLQQQKIIYNAVKYYQANAVSVTGASYKVCAEILNTLFDDCKNQIEPAYKSEE